MSTSLIYLTVEGYGSLVYRPVQAKQVHPQCYRIAEASPDPEHEHWPFTYNDIMYCELHMFAEGEYGLVARALCTHTEQSKTP